MNEASKAIRRRMREGSFKHGRSVYRWDNIFNGVGLDVGAGPDKLPFERCQAFDKEHGDANHLSRYFEKESVDYVAASQCLEHMIDPSAALADWLTVVKPGGYLVQTVPCWELYEGMRWPSRFNPDHRSTWSLWQPDSPAPIHCHLPKWLEQFGREIILCRLVDDNFDYKVGTSKDQTWKEEDGVEAFIEFVLKK